MNIEGQDKELFKQFVEFCDNQPKGKVINHDWWCTCAVGEFLKSIGIKVYSGTTSLNTPEIRKILGDNSPLWKALEARFCPDNYGEFTEFLKQYL